MGFIEESDVRRLLEDETLVAEIAKAVVEDPESMESLADDIADYLSDELEDDPTLRKAIVDAATANPEFKKTIVKKLVADLS